ncbi:protein phosphatase 1, regulatory subunit [Nesidiocoris tenuis]|uniref:Protein phosphatase 1, regulatory subunit n=1 Tax=Nesidiocoris tenuis TaxID=355587 RepID=A0ABN7BCV3_9HEMI|nr:protein phosphatase 1, regulatory subunit [Nesidiocoris tenuis]
MSYRRSTARPSSLYSSSPGLGGLSGLSLSSYPSSSSGYGSSYSQSSPYLNGLSSSPSSYTSYGGMSSGYGSYHLPTNPSSFGLSSSPSVFTSLLSASLGSSSRSSSPSTYRTKNPYSISPTVRSPSASRYPSRSSSFNRHLTRPSRKSDPQLTASTRSLASSEGYESGGEQSEASSRLNSVSVDDDSSNKHPQPTTANGEIDYKKLWEESQAENAILRDKLRCAETELIEAKRSDRTSQARSGMSDAEKREKRAMERKLSEMEEELKQLEQLKCDNQRLKDENGALIRVISKLSK